MHSQEKKISRYINNDVQTSLVILIKRSLKKVSIDGKTDAFFSVKDSGKYLVFLAAGPPMIRNLLR